MSLKAFHIFFITVSVALAVGAAVWALRTANWTVTLLALAAGAGLIVYLGAFRRKASKIGLQ
jgi:hypothetical protein